MIQQEPWISQGFLKFRDQRWVSDHKPSSDRLGNGSVVQSVAPSQSKLLALRLSLWTCETWLKWISPLNVTGTKGGHGNTRSSRTSRTEGKCGYKKILFGQLLMYRGDNRVHACFTTRAKRGSQHTYCQKMAPWWWAPLDQEDTRLFFWFSRANFCRIWILAL